MSGSSAQAPEPVPDCPKCGRPMARRTARRGANAGGEFWGALSIRDAAASCRANRPWTHRPPRMPPLPI